MTTAATEQRTVTIGDYARARECLRLKNLRQGGYKEARIVMEDVLMVLHGDEHRARRRLENRLFRRDTFMHFERDLFPGIISETMAPYIAEGRAELVRLSHQLMMNLAALIAGVDRPEGTPEETFRLHDYLTLFIEGATLDHYTGDMDAKRAEIAEAQRSFDAEFLTPGIERRERLLKAAEEGSATPDEVPRDVLTVLVGNQDNLDLTHEIILREVAFYLLAGAHTSATAFCRTLHNLFSWIEEHPEDAEMPVTDPLFCQRAVHETLRLWPSSPVASRLADEDITLSDGTALAKGDKVVLDLQQVGRDLAVFGEKASEFNPHRDLPEGVQPWGLSFSLGMHACIGQDLASGVLPDVSTNLNSHLYGLVPVAVGFMFDHDCAPDPDNPLEWDTNTLRPYFGKYPVVFNN